ncbi:MAG: O-antigen ligase family protein, partial [Akkermansiaceae bacterium]|nr:O-antigen ligase family protein [Akkermansiaceae bacterium]
PNVAADRLKDAAALWPDSSLSNAAGQLCQAAAARPMIDPAEIVPLLHRADGFYQDAAKAYPYSPHWLLNRANVLVSLSKDDLSGPVADDAEATFKNALYLQGGMEGLLRVRYFYAQFLIYRWDVLWRKERRADEALAKFLYARRLLTEAKDMTEPYIQLDQITSMLTQVEEKIVFLQGAGIEPAATGSNE